MPRQRPLSILLAASLILAGCAVPPAGPAAPAAPLADGAAQARYDADLQACRANARQVGMLSETLDAIVQGALVTAFLAWGLGRSDTGIRDWAGVGGALAGTSQGLQALERHRQIVTSCMSARGHRIPAAAIAGALPPAAAPASRPTLPAVRATGTDTFNAERLARELACHAQPLSILVAKGPGYENYSVPCANGDALAIRCEFGNCRVLR